MKRPLLTALLSLGMAVTSHAAEAFRVYAPSSKTQTLWMVKALPREDGGLELKVAEKRDLGFNGRVIAAHPKKPLLYVSGGGGDRGKVPGAVVTLAQNGSYASHQRVDLNDGAAYLSLDRSGAFLFGVSYGNGRLNVYRLDENGVPGKAVATVDEGKKEAHCVLVSPDNNYLYIPYVKGNLALLQYRFDASSGAVTPLDPLNANPPAGTGPRHLVYHPALPMVYFTNEQGIGLSTYERLADGQLVLKQDIPILPEGMSKEGLSASDLEITPDGKFIFAGLRGHRQDFDRIARYRVGEDGKAELLGLTPADKVPWGLALSPDGNHLLVSATTGATLTAYRITTEGDLEKAASLSWDAEISDLVTLAATDATAPDLSTITSHADLDAVIAATSDARQADVVVYGATPGGFCAAIAAAREGASVVLLEPTAHVGGVNTGGLCFSDSNQTVRSTVMGLFEEWHSRVEKDYQRRGVALPYKVSEKDHTRWTYEPHVAARITREMLDEAGVKVMTRQVLKSVTKEGTRITQLITSGGEFEAKTFIDGTYEGDLMAAAGVSWTIGREGRKEFGESLAGKQYPKSKMMISGFGADGKPLPLITTTDAGPEDAGDKNVMVYSFRLCVTKDAANRVPFPKPAKYDPARFEVVRRYFAQEKRPVLLWDLYPLPGNKFDANNGIGKQFSMGLVGACNGWSEADEAGRAAIWEAHKQYTLEFYHFLTTDPAVPEHLRKEMSELGLCRDEFADYGHWSPQLYVREGRRMIGKYVVSQKDIMEQPEKPDAIVVSSFPIDSHDCQRVGTGEFVVNEGTIMPVRMPGRKHGYPYHVPYRAITPKTAECTNLLVPVALSCTHVGISSIRVEPTWMILGQSAGIAAALSSKQGLDVQKLPYPALRERLLAQKQVLDLPVLAELPPEPKDAMSIDPKTLPGIVLDDAQAELKGAWSHSSNFKPHIGKGYLHDDKRGDGESSAVFRVKLPQSGRYELRMAYSAHGTRAAKVPLTIINGEKTVELLVDQTQPLPTGEAFRLVGKVELQKDLETTITIRNAETDGFVIMDALQLVAE